MESHQAFSDGSGRIRSIIYLVELVRIIYIKPLPMRRCIPAELRGLALRNLVVAEPSLGVYQHLYQHLPKLINSFQLHLVNIKFTGLRKNTSGEGGTYRDIARSVSDLRKSFRKFFLNTHICSAQASACVWLNGIDSGGEIICCPDQRIEILDFRLEL